MFSVAPVGLSGFRVCNRSPALSMVLDLTPAPVVAAPSSRLVRLISATSGLPLNAAKRKARSYGPGMFGKGGATAANSTGMLPKTNALQLAQARF